MSAFQPAVRAVISEALEAARRHPENAAAAARAGMALHAHEQFSAATACYRRAHGLDRARFDYLYYWGVALAADGKNAEAVAPLEQALAINGMAIPARLRLADALLAAGKTDEARGHYRLAIGQDAGLAVAHYGLGRTLSGEAAASEFRRALELFPAYGAARFALAAHHRQAGRAAEAERALQGYEQNRLAVPPLADPLLEAVYALDASANGLLRQARALERLGRLEEAAALCERAVAREPKFEQGWINLTSLYGRLDKGGELEWAFRQAVALAPRRAEPFYNLGTYYLRRERVDEARQALEKALAADPGHPDSLHNLAVILEGRGELDRAAALFRRAIAARPDFRLAHFHLGRIYANQRRHAEAIAEFETALQPADEQTPTFLYALAATHARAGHRDQAAALLRQAREQAAAAGQADLAASIRRDLGALTGGGK